MAQDIIIPGVLVQDPEISLIELFLLSLIAQEQRERGSLTIDQFFLDEVGGDREFWLEKVRKLRRLGYIGSSNGQHDKLRISDIYSDTFQLTKPTLITRAVTSDRVLLRSNNTKKQKETNLSDTPLGVSDLNKPVPADLKEYYTYWVNKGLHTYRDSKTKGFAQAIRYLRRVKNGTMFNTSVKYEEWQGKKWDLKEWRWAVDSFVKGAKEVDSKFMFSLPLHSFIYDSWRKKSFLIEHTVVLSDDPHPKITNLFQQWYKREVLGGITWQPNAWIQKKFFKATERLLAFYEDNKGRIVSYRGDPKLNLAQYLCDCLKDSAKDTSEIKPGYFCSDHTFFHRLPSYLNKMNLLTQKTRTSGPTYGQSRNLSDKTKG